MILMFYFAIKFSEDHPSRLASQECEDQDYLNSTCFQTSLNSLINFNVMYVIITKKVLKGSCMTFYML